MEEMNKPLRRIKMKIIEKIIKTVLHKDNKKETKEVSYDTTELMKLYNESIKMATEGIVR